VLHDLHAALSALQSNYFSLWLGQWTTAIDWTAAVTGTHLSATLSTLSHSIPYTLPLAPETEVLTVPAQLVDHDINKYFAHLIAFYFGQDHFALRMQAYDDMLWVVLEWLSSIQLIRGHSSAHYDGKAHWHASQFVPAFAHRARVFYELAAPGWDERLCGGGMTWNPRLLPYKNAITNELWISASIEMYLEFPGDENCSPFNGADQSDSDHANEEDSTRSCEDGGGEPEDREVYLQNAVKGYDWLKGSGMMNADGLYTDGFHISGYEQNQSRTECDERNEMVYTYNQGVLLSGLRGLWEATGNTSYLNDGHALINSVIRATGWKDSENAPGDAQPGSDTEGGVLGDNGILAEACDPTGTCSQERAA
jgi:hypothetical protein